MNRQIPLGMNGQWRGAFNGTSSGRIIVNVDELPTCYQGWAYLFYDNHHFPNMAVKFSTEDKGTRVHFITRDLYTLNPDTDAIEPWDKLKSRYPLVTSMSTTAEAQGLWDDDALRLSWVTDIKETGLCKLPRAQTQAESSLQALNLSWSKYKAHVSQFCAKRHLFRGQNRQWRLRTSFHRTGRADLQRFLDEDVPALHRHLSGKTKHFFNPYLMDPDQNGAFYNLIQHHGYPTPLLDWTYSPYVAAFFAYRGTSREDELETERKVRVLSFDQKQWRTDLQQVLNVVSPHVHLSVAEFMSIENARMVPQQAASTVTNIDDLESYISEVEAQNQRQYLWAIDLPIEERREVLRELAYMGITAGSLFPGLDGACEELKARYCDLQF